MKKLFVILLVLCLVGLSCFFFFRYKDAFSSDTEQTTSAKAETTAEPATSDTESVDNTPDDGYVQVLADIASAVKASDTDALAKAMFDPYYLEYMNMDADKAEENLIQYIKALVGKENGYKVLSVLPCKKSEISKVSQEFEKKYGYDKGAIENVVLLNVEFFGEKLTVPAVAVDGIWYINFLNSPVLMTLCDITVEAVFNAVKNLNSNKLYGYTVDEYYLEYLVECGNSLGADEIIDSYRQYFAELEQELGNINVSAGKSLHSGTVDELSAVSKWFSDKYNYPSDSIGMVAYYEYPDFAIHGNNEIKYIPLDVIMILVDGKWYMSTQIDSLELLDCITAGHADRIERYFKAICENDGSELYDLVVDKYNYDYMISDVGFADKKAIVESYSDYYLSRNMQAIYGEDYSIGSYTVKSLESANDYLPCGVEAINAYLFAEFGYDDGYVKDVVFVQTEVEINSEITEKTDMELVMIYTADEKWYISDILFIDYAKEIIDLYNLGEFELYFGIDDTDFGVDFVY